MSGILFVITHYLGPGMIGLGDLILQTPLIRWLRAAAGRPVDVGTFAEFEWLIRRCPGAGAFEEVRSPREARQAAGSRLLIMNDYSFDEYGWHRDDLTYTQAAAARVGIPVDAPELQTLIYRPTPGDRKRAAAVIADLGCADRPIVTGNIKGKTRTASPGLTADGYRRLFAPMIEATGCVVILGDWTLDQGSADVRTVSVELPVWAALIEQSVLWVGESTGPYHLARALGVSTAMFSATGQDNAPWCDGMDVPGRHAVYKGLSGHLAAIEETGRRLAGFIMEGDGL